MSSKILREIGSKVREAAIEAVWMQWRALGAHATGLEPASRRSIIDPEALLLLSLQMAPEERRLYDFVYWWAGSGSELLSVQRAKTLARRFPVSAQESFTPFAHWAVDAGDKRWKRYRLEVTPDISTRGGKGSDVPRLKEAPALMLRLRSGFGVGAKADVLTYLLGIGDRAASVSQAAEGVGYSRATVTSVMRDLVLAGFIREAPNGRRFRAPSHEWATLLSSGAHTASASESTPVWRYWADMFAFLAHVGSWTRQAVSDTDSTYVLSSRARDLYEEHKDVFEYNRIAVPTAENHRGASYLEAFAETVHMIAEWTLEHL